MSLCFSSQVLFPLVFTKLLKKVDIEAHVDKYSGEIAVAGGIRYGISRCIVNFVDEERKEKMRLGKFSKHTSSPMSSTSSSVNTGCSGYSAQPSNQRYNYSNYINVCMFANPRI